MAQLDYNRRLNRDDPLRQELRALEEATAIKKNKGSRTHEQISTHEASINRYEGEEKAKRLQKMKAEKRSSWNSLQAQDVFREAAGKSLLSGDVQLEVTGTTKAWKTRDQDPPPSPTPTTTGAASPEPTLSPAQVIQRGRGQFPAGVREDK